MKKKGQHLLFVVFLMIAILLGMRSISLWLWFAYLSFKKEKEEVNMIKEAGLPTSEVV